MDSIDFSKLERIAWAVIIVSIIIIGCDWLWWKTEAFVFVGIGCSLVASSSFVILENIARKKQTLDEWNIQAIYPERSYMNADADLSLKNAHKSVDVIAMGLKSFREQQTKRTKKLLNKGVNFRIITMDPNSGFAKQRDKEEGHQEGEISKSINDLIAWAKTMNSSSGRGKIQVKAYSCMTLDFYWRNDNNIYVGPYLYGYASQRTISYKFIKPGKGFSFYEEYFDKIWNDDTLLKQLV